MGLYNAVFGMNPFSSELLKVLNLTPDDFGRFRDAFLVDSEVAVYTRIGGGNRPEYEHVYERLKNHPRYARCVNDTYDSTYCTFYFNLTPEEKEQLRSLGIADIGRWDPEEKWKQGFKQIDSNPAEAQRVAEALTHYTKVIDSAGKMRTFGELLDALKKPRE